MRQLLSSMVFSFPFEPWSWKSTHPLLDEQHLEILVFEVEAEHDAIDGEGGPRVSVGVGHLELASVSNKHEDRVTWTLWQHEGEALC